MWEEMSLCKRLLLKDFSSLILITFLKQHSTKFFRSSQQKPELRPTKNLEAKYNKVKAKLALLSSGASTSKSSMVKNKCVFAEPYEWDEDVSFNDNEMVEVKVHMALGDDENITVGKESARIEKE
ncbi:hypothetical protein Tco_0638208 [Tanacetum coccineum]